MDGLRKEEEENSEYSLGESESKGGREGAPLGFLQGIGIADFGKAKGR